MTCKFCHIELPMHSIYCHICGKRQVVKVKQHRRHRHQSQGSITKLSNRSKPYWARLPADYSSGQPVRQSLGCYQTYAAAEQAIVKALQQKQDTPLLQQQATLSDLYVHFIEGQYYASLSPGTQTSHRTAWKHLSSIADTPITKLNADTFQRPIDSLKKHGCKQATLAKVRNLCSLLCREAIGLGLILTNYAHFMQLGKNDATPPKPFSSTDLKILWNAADAGDQDSMAALLLIYTGMRPVELLSINLSDHLHTLENYRYFVIGSKTAAGKNRIIPVPVILDNILDSLIDHRTEGALIRAPKGGYYRVDNWRARHFHPLMKRLGFVGYTPYSCRHTYADIQKRRQISPEIMRLIMGHEDYATTVERYHTTTEEDIARICGAVDGITRPE